MSDSRSKRLIEAADAYHEAFNQLPPEPFGVHDDTIAARLERAVRERRPIDPDYDWWADLPPNAVA